MIISRVLLGKQLIECHIQSESNKSYVGKMLAPIEDKHILNYWVEYESAVNNMLLMEVDRLEHEMKNYNFQIFLNDKILDGENIDLQIFPSNLGISFNVA